MTLSKEEKKEFRIGLFTIILTFMILFFLGAAIIGCVDSQRQTRACVSGGYAQWVNFNNERLCIGITDDGEVKTEWLADVRERLDAR